MPTRGRERQTERFLTTVLFTDIVGSTELAAELGDRGWRDLVQEHHRIVRSALRRHGGREMDTAGDGFFAIFDAPAEAAACALDAIEAVRALGIEIRAGLHVGEVEQIGAKVGGITVPIAARIMATAGGSELIVSNTVRDLAAGSGLRFEDRGERALKGVPGTWRLYCVARPTVQTAAEPGEPAQSSADLGARRAAAVRRAEARPIWQKRPRLTAGVAVGLVILVGVAGAYAWSPWRPKALAGITENSVGVIDPARNEIIAATAVDAQPGGMAAGDGAIWVTNTGANSVSHIDPKTRAVVDTIDVGKSPTGIAVGGGAVWVANSDERSVSRIDPRIGRVVATIAVGNGPTAIAFGAGAAWVANTGDGTVMRIDPATSSAGAPVSVGSLPVAVAVDKDGVWVASQDGATVSHLDTSSGAALGAPIPVGTRPSAIAIGGGSVWVANAGDGTVSRIDPGADRAAGLITVGGAPTSLTFDRDTLWVADGVSAVDRLGVTNPAAPVRVAAGSAPQAVAVIDGEVWFATRASLESHRGGTLRVVAQHLAIDPQSFALPEFNSLVGDGLVGYRRIGGIAGSQLRPALAVALPKPTDGGLTYTFRLRSGLTYSDGNPLKASDFLFTFERIFEASGEPFGNTGGELFAGLAGAEACLPAPVKRCDLSKAVVADDAANTVVFHLLKPDPDFLYKLGIPVADILEPGTVSSTAFTTAPFPGTGPYMIASASSTEVRLVRNPHFRSWDSQVRPPGYPDEIVWRIGVDPADEVAMVERGEADYMAEQIPADAFSQIETVYAPQLHVTAQSTTSMFLNTKLAPFGDLDVRRALNFAVDRTAVAELRGGKGGAVPTCQVLPPNFPGYQPYCPYTKNPTPDGRGEWSAPDLVAAQALVAKSGKAAKKIVVGPFSPRLNPIAHYVVGLLREIGFTNVSERDETDNRQVFKAILEDKNVQIGAFEFRPDVAVPDTFMAAFTCAEPDGFTNYCDPGFDALVKEARDLQLTDAASAADRWAAVDRKVTDLALWVPMVNEGSDFVSANLGNYQYNLSYGILLDQAWVK